MNGKLARWYAVAAMTALSVSLVVALCEAARAAGLSPTTGGTRVKDVATVLGLGKHKLVGYGLVTGLDGSGDSDRSVIGAQSLANMLHELGVTIDAGAFQVKNVAAVIVTGELPAIAPVGTPLDVTVSSIGDASSLQGGMLLVTPLKGADGQVYALAQGPVSIGGFNVSGGVEKAQKNHPTVGRVPNGASVTAEVAAEGDGGPSPHAPLAPPAGETPAPRGGGPPPHADPPHAVSLLLHEPDFTTAQRLAHAINEGFGATLATAANATCVQVAIPADAAGDLVGFMSRLESLPVEPDAPARVVINERTGTVVIGARVRISPVAISHGSLTVEVRGEYQVSQPGPVVQVAGEPAPAAMKPAQAGPRAGETPAPPAVVAGGQTVVVPQQNLKVEEAGGNVVEVAPQATLQDLVGALNALGVKPRDLIAIIQALKEAGALQAEVVAL